MKLIVHGYLGQKASKEMEQFHTKGELRRIAHFEDGVWIAPTRSTFKSYLPDVFPEKPYVIHQNSPLAWSLLSFIHQQQDAFPARNPSANLHRQMNTLYLESLKYGLIMHAKRIMRTIEEGCMKCLRRKKQYLKASIGQPQLLRCYQAFSIYPNGPHRTTHYGRRKRCVWPCMCLSPDI